MIHSVIIDDQSIHHDILKRNLLLYCPEVKVVAEFFSGAEALAHLPTLKFDILFLDIELEDMTSFEMLQKLPYRDLHIIFITSFDKYAVQAFKVHAVDYLMKPVDGIELSKAIERAMAQIIDKERRMGLISEYSIQKNNKILVPEHNEYKLVEIDFILYCKADGNYTDLMQLESNGGELKYTDTHNLKYYEEKLKSFGFIRIHQSYLANKAHVSKIRKNPSELIMSNGTVLPIARDRKQDILDMFSGII
jgi:two-component system LytT family response regulator